MLLYLSRTLSSIIITLSIIQNQTIFSLLFVEITIHNFPPVIFLQQDIDKEWDIVSSLVKGDISSLSHSDIDADATDAWAVLTDPVTTSDPQDQLLCFIQAILCYWMYATVAKKILQILTPEALILWRRWGHSEQPLMFFHSNCPKVL